MDKKVTISDVAARCGVSKTTISRFLNGKYDNISLATRERIQAVIEEMDYQPDRTAQRLKAKKSMLVGCVIGDISSPFSALLLKGIMGVCEAAGYQVLFADANDEPMKERSAIQSFYANRVDGFIINTSGGNEDLFLSLKREGIPVVLADRGSVDSREIDSVMVNNFDAAYNCVKLLKDYGYERIGFFTEGNKQITPRILRYKGYCKGMEDFFPDRESEMYVFERNDEESCKREIRRFRENAKNDSRIAILTVNGVTTQRVMMGLKGLEIRLGRDFGLCGFDDWSWLQLVPSGITSVSLPTVKMGESAAKLLLERMTGQRSMDSKAVQLQLPAELIVRGSTVK